MSRGGALFVAALVVLAVVSLLFQEDRRVYTPTSHGTLAGGHRALHDLLLELGLPVERSYEPPELLPAGAVVWWVEPEGLCDPEPAAGDGDAAADAAADAEHEADEAVGPGAGLAAFVREGGTAVVLLRARDTLFGPRAAPCAGLAGRALPPWIPPDPGAGAGPQVVDGPLVRRPRTLELPGLARFAGGGGWSVALRVGDAPFALRSWLGRGHVLVVADGTFLRNAWLDRGDAAPLAADLVRAAGVPRLDEHAHGLRLDRPALAVLAGLGAVPVFLGVIALGLLLLWRGAAVPAGFVAPPPAAAPVLGAFVDGLARLYARTRDHARLAERYRRLSLDRIRRHLGLPHGVSEDALLARLRREGHTDAAGLTLLAGAAPAESAAEWRRRARRLDALVKEVCA